jgi:hypothetical protein
MLSMALSLATEMVSPRGSKLAWLTQLATMPLQQQQQQTGNRFGRFQ